MKKALIISYFFPPAQSVAGARTFSWATYFKRFGIQPTIITRHWHGDEKNWIDLTGSHSGEIQHEQFPDFDIYKLPASKNKWLDIYNKYLPLKVVRKLMYLAINAFGHFNAEADARASFRDFLFTHLKDNQYDFMIVSSPPLNVIRLAVELKKRYHIPLHVDFRDLWNNGYLNKEYMPDLKTKWMDRFKKSYLLKWMKHADSVSTVSSPIAEFLKLTFKREVWVLTNGFDETLYAEVNRKPSPKFRISMMGSYYGKQKLDILINGLKQFLKDKLPDEIGILILGLNVNESVFKSVLEQLPAEFINVKDRVGTREAAEYAVNTEVILHATWQGYKGIYTTKLFDFIASGNNILVAPGDHDVSDALIMETGTGKISGDALQVAAFLEAWYIEWKKTGRLAYHGNRNLIEKYNRKVIAENFATLLKAKYV